MPRPVRVLLSKIGLDGHDRGAKLIVRNLRDAGMEVIYTGLWQTPETTVSAALQEDVDVLGISLLSAAHMTIVPEVVRLCAASGLSGLPVVVGGIIPEQDKQPLVDAGCAGVYTPGTPTSAIVDSVRALAERRREACARLAPPDLTRGSDLPRALTWIADGRAAELHIPPARGRALTLGITGAPGVGKSTFIGRLARQLRDRGHRVGVLAVDPTSPLTGGSLLGDRLRMMQAQPDERLFVRSLSSAGEPGGIAPCTAECAAALRAAGYDVVLIETVGTGQNEVAVRNVSDAVLLLLMPGAGDSVQFTKAGIVEIATGFVVNKADLPGADLTIKDLRESLDDDRPVWAVSALRGEGLDALSEWIEARLDG